MADGIVTNARVCYIDPNELVRSQYNNKQIDNVVWRPEDYTMDVDLQVIVPDRDMCGKSNVINSSINLTNSANVTFEENSMYRSFFGGTKLTQNGNNYLTDDYTVITYTEIKNGKVSNKEYIGIKNIDVKFSSNFFPEVTITFADVRGLGLMQPMVLGVEGESNFFEYIFHFPYPLFLLTLRGYYGQRVTFSLAVSDFDSQLNSSNGNFEITVKFIGYMYGLYTDIPFNLLLAAPYYTENGASSNANEYWNKRVEDGSFTFNDNGSNGAPIPTFIEFMKKYVDLPMAMKNAFSDDELMKVETDISNLNTYKDVLNELVKNAEKRFQYVKLVDIYDSGFEDDVAAVLCINPNSDVEYNDEGEVCVFDDGLYLKACKAEYKTGLDKFTEVTEDEPFNPVCAVGDIGELNGKTEDEINYHKLIHKHIEENFYDGQFYSVITFSPSIGTINKRIEELIEKKKELSANPKDKISEIAIKELGFKPTVENFFRMLYAHIDCFMQQYYTLLSNIDAQRNDKSRTCTILGIDSKNSDIPDFYKDDSFVPPFPAFYEKNTETNQMVLKYPGELDKAKDILEVNFVKNFLEGSWMTSFIGKRIMEYARTLNGWDNSIGGGTGKENEPYKLNFVPTSISDTMLNGTNPYMGVNSETNDAFETTLYIFGHRLKCALLTNRTMFSGKKWTDICKIEAINFKKAHNTIGEKFSSAINNGADEALKRLSEFEKNKEKKVLNADKITYNKTNTYLINSFITNTLDIKENILNIDEKTIKRGIVKETIDSINSLKNSKVFTEGDVKELNNKKTYSNEIKYSTNSAVGRIYTKKEDGEISEKVKDEDYSASTTDKNYVPFIGSSYNILSAKNGDNDRPHKQLLDSIEKNGVTNEAKTMALVFLASMPTSNGIYNEYKNIIQDKESKIIEAWKPVILYIGGLLWRAKNYEEVKDIKINENNKFGQFQPFKDKNGMYSDNLKNSDMLNSEDIKSLFNDLSDDEKKQLTDYFENWVKNTFIRLYNSCKDGNLEDKKINGTEYKCVKGDTSDILISEIIGRVGITKVIIGDEGDVSAREAISEFLSTLKTLYENDEKDSGSDSNTVTTTTNGNEGGKNEKDDNDDGNDDGDNDNNNDTPNNNSGEVSNGPNSSGSNELKLSLYSTLKLLYDKWLASYKWDTFMLPSPVKTLSDRRIRYISNGRIEQDYEFNNFIFVDSFYNDLSEKLFISIKDIFDLVDEHLQGNQNYSAFHFMKDICDKSKLLFLSLPVYNNFYNYENIVEMFEPNVPYGRINPIKKTYGNTYAIMYMHEPSKNLGNKNNFRDDGICDIRDNTVTSLFNVGNTDGNLTYSVPTIGVSYARQAQSYFTNIQVNMETPKMNDFAIKNLFDLISYTKEGSPNKGVTMAQDMFSIYSNRTYSCKIEMLGCMNILPLMYFQLNNVPMFRGVYIILDIKHSISSGHFKTTFQGVRISKNSIPLNTDILEINLIKELLENRYKVSGVVEQSIGGGPGEIGCYGDFDPDKAVERMKSGPTRNVTGKSPYDNGGTNWSRGHCMEAVKDFVAAGFGLECKFENYFDSVYDGSENEEAKGCAGGYWGGLALIQKPSNEKWGFHEVFRSKKRTRDEVCAELNNFGLIKGDIVISIGKKGLKWKGNTTYGHISMYSGDAWVSDGNQGNDCTGFRELVEDTILIRHKDCKFVSGGGGVIKIDGNVGWIGDSQSGNKASKDNIRIYFQKDLGIDLKWYAWGGISTGAYLTGKNVPGSHWGPNTNIEGLEGQKDPSIAYKSFLEMKPNYMIIQLGHNLCSSKDFKQMCDDFHNVGSKVILIKPWACSQVPKSKLDECFKGIKEGENADVIIDLSMFTGTSLHAWGDGDKALIENCKKAISSRIKGYIK